MDSNSVHHGPGMRQEESMLRLPYGVSNFAKLTNKNYYFVDRTPFISQLEQVNEPYLFFLRHAALARPSLSLSYNPIMA